MKIENLISIGKFKIENIMKILNCGFFIIVELIEGKISEEIFWILIRLE